MEFENIVKTKGNKFRFNLKEKLKDHLKEIGFDILFIEELLKRMDEKSWPDPIKSEKLRLNNKNIIETYSNLTKNSFLKLLFI